MIRKFFLAIIVIFLIVIAVKVSVNTLINNPKFIAKKLEGQIAKTQSLEFKTYKDWLWKVKREFIFDIVYMNIFSPGISKMLVSTETKVNNTPAFILEATAEPNDFFKKIYNAKVMLSSAVKKDPKVSLWYREEILTPDKSSLKEIVFDLSEKIAKREDVKIRITDNTYDPLSVFFIFLGSEFKIGEPIVLDLLSKRDIYEFRVTPKEVANDIYKLEGEVCRKNRSSSTHRASFVLWVKDGRVRIPLLIKVISAGGSVYLRLKTVN